MQGAILSTPIDDDVVKDWLVNYISSVLDVPTKPFPENERFDHYGLDSIEVTIMCGLMEEQFHIEVNPDDVFENPNVVALARHIARCVAETVNKT